MILSPETLMIPARHTHIAGFTLIFSRYGNQVNLNKKLSLLLLFLQLRKHSEGTMLKKFPKYTVLKSSKEINPIWTGWGGGGGDGPPEGFC